MKKKLFKRMMAGVCMAVFVAMSSMTALAAKDAATDGTDAKPGVSGTGDAVTVTGSGKYEDTTKVVVGYQDKDLFSNMKNLMPGDTIENTVKLSNDSGRTVTIYMKAYPDFESADGKIATRSDSTASADGKTFKGDVLDQITMTLTLDDKVIYKGSADGEKPVDAEKYQVLTEGDYGISLGSFSSDSSKILKVELALPGPEFDNSFADSFDAVDWVFCVEGTTPHDGGGGGGGGGGGRRPTPVVENPGPGVPSVPGEDVNVVITDGSLPKMGDAGVQGYVFGILAMLLLVCGAVYMKKRISRS